MVAQEKVELAALAQHAPGDIAERARRVFLGLEPVL
jgi:hypothetical protein